MGLAAAAFSWGRAASGPPTTIAQDFPGAHLILLDPYDAAGAPISEEDRFRLPDTSGAHNDAVRLVTSSSGSVLPFTGTAPTIVTVDGNPALNFNGSADNLAGWFTGTPTGENWIPRSESMSADWTFSNVTASEGPSPPAETGATSSVMLYGNSTTGYHYAQTIVQPPPGGFQAGARYSISVCVYSVALVTHSMLQIDNLGWFQTVDITNGSLGYSVGSVEATHTVDSIGGGWYRIRYSFVAPYSNPLALPFIVWMLGPSGTIGFDATGCQMAVTAPCFHPTRTLSQGCKYHVTAGSPWYAQPVTAATLVVVSRQPTPASNRALFDSVDSGGGTNTGPMMAKESTRLARSFWAGSGDLNYTSSNDSSLIMQVATTDGLIGGFGRFYERTTQKVQLGNNSSSFFKPRVFYGVGRLINTGSILWPWIGDICFVGYWPQVVDTTWIGAMSVKLGAKFSSLAA